MSCSPTNHDMRPGTQSCGIAPTDLWASGQPHACARIFDTCTGRMIAFKTPYENGKRETYLVFTCGSP